MRSLLRALLTMIGTSPAQRARYALIAIGCLLAAPAVAQPGARDAGPEQESSRGEDTRGAIELSHEARELFDAGRYDAAFERFAEAEAKAHSPVFLLYMARARQHAGRLMEARSLYRRVMDERLADEAPAPMKQAREDARDELARLELRIPSLVVVVEGAGAETAKVRVDDRVARAGTPVDLDPGSHRVVVIAGKGPVRSRQIDLGEGQTRRVAVSLGEPAAAQPGSLVPGALLTALGGAGLATGAITGGIALSITEDIKSRCEGVSCLVADEPDGDRARALATASTVSFAVGGAVAVAGVTLLVLRPGGGDGKDPHREPAEARIHLGPRGLWLHGRF